LIRLWPGFGVAALIAVTATFVSERYGGPQFLFALLFGIAFNFLAIDPRTRPGIEFTARTVLRFGVGLLGARITVEQISALGVARLGGWFRAAADHRRRPERCK